MDIQAAGINSYYAYQSALERGSGLTSSSYSSGAQAQNTQINQAPPLLPDDEEEVGSVSQAQTDEAAQEKNQPSEADAESRLTPDEKLLIEKLKKVDGEVRAHEMAHIAAGGAYITSGATFSYQQGPDGKKYAVGGEVTIDTSSETGDPKATLQKMRRVRAAALAPAQPSSQDLKVAANAVSQAAKAMAEITQLISDGQDGEMGTTVPGYTRQQIADAYAKTGSMSDQDIPNQNTQNSFHIAV